MIVSGVIYEDGKYWIFLNDKKLFTVCQDVKNCSYIIGHASTFEEAKKMIENYKEGEK